MSIPIDIFEQVIKNNKVILFTKSYCPSCKKAKELLDSLDIKYEFIDLDLHPEGEKIQAYLGEKTGHKTVPSVWINQKFIGGSDDLAKLNESDELKKLLA